MLMWLTDENQEILIWLTDENQQMLIWLTDENQEMLIWLTDENQEMLIWLTVTKMYYSLSTRHLDVSCRAWNYNTNRNNMSVNSFIKAYSIPFDMGLKQIVIHYKQKTEVFPVTRPQLLQLLQDYNYKITIIFM